MAGNREVYQQHMETGHSAAWDQDWQAAIKAYTQAARELPEDPEAHIHLGLSLLRAGRLDDSLKVYGRAHRLSPDDPVPLEKSADILERIGRLKEAAQHYVKVSDIYLGLRDLDKAIGNWERATQLSPGLTSIHAKLAQAYERTGDRRRAIREYLTLAFNFRREGDVKKAMKAVERALRLDRNNPQALNIMNALRSGADINPMAVDADAPKKPRRSLDDDLSRLDDDRNADDRSSMGDSDPLGPMGEAMDQALGLLAEHVVESGALDASGASALQAMEFQRQDRRPEAIQAYQAAAPSLRHPALQLSLGVLLVLEDQPDAAIQALGEAMVDPNLSAGAMHALGVAYFKSGKQKKASRYLIQSLQAVDAALIVSESEAAELQSVYDRLFTAIDEGTDESMTVINERFIDLLSGADWKQRVAETRRILDDIMKSGGAGGVRDFLGTSGTDDLTESVARIDRFIRQGYYTLAIDEAHRAVEKSPFYLPLHVRMAEIMMREQRVRQAINKYNTVARAYLVRDETERAASILTEVLEMAPLDTEVRISLLDLLEREERWDDALDQYIQLAQVYHQLGNVDGARDAYSAAETLAGQMQAPVGKMIQVKLAIAELSEMRLETRAALATYEEIITLDPSVEQAYIKLVDIFFNQGNQVEAIRRLDQLLGLYAKKKQVSKITKTLERMVRTYPKDPGLLSRMAGIYRQLGRRDEAIAHLDTLGEIQLEAGNHKDAAKTIKQIIRLNPPNVDDYRRLLSQLGG